MNRCTIYANCQAGGIAHFLRKARFPFEIEVFHNYQLILGEQSPEALYASASRCDLFIYQPTDEMKHGDLSSDAMLDRAVSKSAKTISFAYQFNDAFFPLVLHGETILGADRLNPDYWKMPRAELLALYRCGELDFALNERLWGCAAEQSRREQQCDVRSSGWIIEHSAEQLFLNVNHPASALYAHLARVIYELAVDDAICQQMTYENENEAAMPCCLPVSPYIVKHYGWRKTLDDSQTADAQKCYGDLLMKAYDERNQS